MKNSVKKHYDDYWSKDRGTAEIYDRNLILPSLFSEGEKVLDVGCGNGIVAEYLKNNAGVQITGVDISKVAVDQAKRRGVNAYLMDVDGKLPFKNGQFDAVFWGDNIEHLFDPMQTLKEIQKVLKKEGKLIISCPNMSYWRYRIYYLLRGNLPDTEWSGYPRWYWSHIRFFDKGTLQEMLTSVGFGTFKLIGVSSRRLDKPFLKLWPALFGMIMIMEARS